MPQEIGALTPHPENGAERRLDRRVDTRTGATVSFLVRDLELRGRLENLSLSGARFIALDEAPRGAGHLIEIAFFLNGNIFRLTGVVQWNNDTRLGLQFEPMSDRRRQMLEEALLLETIRIRTEEEARQEAVPSPAAVSVVPVAPIAVPDLPPTRRERRAHPRLRVNMPAGIYMIRSGIRLNGTVADLSLSGCRVHIEQVAKVDIYTRIETSFFHLGMPFRVAGVIQALHGPSDVGIRFLDVSERISTKLKDLMAEIEADTKN